MIRRRYVFKGMVQGVGFRYHARYHASALGLTGWVRNEYDGSVTMEVQGDVQSIDRRISGPSAIPVVDRLFRGKRRLSEMKGAANVLIIFLIMRRLIGRSVSFFCAKKSRYGKNNF